MIFHYLGDFFKMNVKAFEKSITFFAVSMTKFIKIICEIISKLHAQVQRNVLLSYDKP